MAAADDVIRLRYPASCAVCGKVLVRGSIAHWDRTAKVATCLTCIAAAEATPAPAIEVNRGQPGASAAREWQRRHSRREASVRERYKRFSGLVLALSSDPQSTTAWATGARGEQVIGRSLNQLREEGIAVLHDRRLPGSKANIDHIVVSSSGVFVIDTKHYSGRVEQRDVGGLFKTDLRLYVNGRDRTKLVAGVDPQIRAVRSLLAGRQEWGDLPLTGALLFMSQDNWPLFAMRPLRFGSVYVLWGKALGKLIRARGPVTQQSVSEIELALAMALPAA